MQLGQGPADGAPGASARLCAYLNDMRELRTKQGELTAAFKACVPAAWWGTDAGYKSQLGDRFKMCQVMQCVMTCDAVCTCKTAWMRGCLCVSEGDPEEDVHRQLLSGCELGCYLSHK